MAKHKQRRRPEASMYEDEHFRADVLPSPAGPTIEIYAKPHHKLLFKASHEGLFFWCKRCRDEHLLRWEGYDVWAAAPHIMLRVCPVLQESDEVTSGQSWKTYILQTLTQDAIEVIARLRDALTRNNKESG